MGSFRNIIANRSDRKTYDFICKKGCLQSPDDDRDYIKVVAKKAASNALTPDFSLVENPIILNQGNTNSCTGHAATYFMNILMRKTLGDNAASVMCNPFYNYYYARLESNLLNKDGGAYLRSTLNALKNYGVWNCDMRTPYSKPPTDVDTNNFKLKGYERITQVCNTELTSDMKYILSDEKLPLLINLNIVDENRNSYTGKITADEINPRDDAWHAMTVIGYDTDDNGETWFEVLNSWGNDWGDHGKAWVHELYFRHPRLVHEIWCPTKLYY